MILCYLKLGPLRYAELRKLIPNLSDKVLSQRLRELTEAGLIERSKPARGKPGVYVLAARAESLGRVLTDLYIWGDTNAAKFGVTVGHPLKSIGKRPGSRASTCRPSLFRRNVISQ